MAQWRRETLGYQFDPEPGMDIRWEEEFSSCDYDSQDLHSSVDSDSSSDEATTDYEDDFDAEQPDMYVIEDHVTAGAVAAVPVPDGAEKTDTAPRCEENAEVPVVDAQSSSDEDKSVEEPVGEVQDEEAETEPEVIQVDSDSCKANVASFFVDVALKFQIFSAPLVIDSDSTDADAVPTKNDEEPAGNGAGDMNGSDATAQGAMEAGGNNIGEITFVHV